MKKLFYYFCILFALGISACNPCRNVDCGNGTCNDGSCTCNAGYEKDTNGNCTVEEREKFLGNWTGVLNFSGPLTGSGSATVSITQAASIQSVVINNVFTCGGVSIPITATVSGKSIGTMNSVTCDSGAGILSINFSAVNIIVNGTVMTFSINYTVSEGGTSLGSGAVTGTLNK